MAAKQLLIWHGVEAAQIVVEIRLRRIRRDRIEAAPVSIGDNRPDLPGQYKVAAAYRM